MQNHFLGGKTVPKIVYFFITALQNTERQTKQKWLEKDKILADLNAMKHKMRQLQGQ